MIFAADAGPHSSRATPSLHEAPHRQYQTATGRQSTYLSPETVQTSQAGSQDKFTAGRRRPGDDRIGGFEYVILVLRREAVLAHQPTDQGRAFSTGTKVKLNGAERWAAVTRRKG
jgi:hypothetical protein